VRTVLVWEGTNIKVYRLSDHAFEMLPEVVETDADEEEAVAVVERFGRLVDSIDYDYIIIRGGP